MKRNCVARTEIPLAKATRSLAAKQKSVSLPEILSMLEPAGLSTADLDKRLLCPSQQASVFSFGTDRMAQSRLQSRFLGSHHNDKNNNLLLRKDTNCITLRNTKLPENSARLLDEMSAVYLDLGFLSQRQKQVKNRIDAVNQSIAKAEAGKQIRCHREKTARNEVVLRELTDLRKRYSTDKKLRVSKTYVSVAALEKNDGGDSATMYGLPRAGEEHATLPPIMPQDKQYHHLWRQAVARTNNVMKILKRNNIRNESNLCPQLHRARFDEVETQIDCADD